MKPIVVGIIGGTGYTGMELLRLFGEHPQAEVRLITSRSEAGRPVSDLFPALRGICELQFTDPDTAEYGKCDVIISAAPNGVAMNHAPGLLKLGVKLIDLSADFRLKDIAQWERWYGLEHSCADLVEQAVYGLPEINREAIRDSNLVANPGCYPTAVQIGFLPLLEAGMLQKSSLIADAKSGVSGAGRKASVSIAYGEISESFKAYAASGHRHLPEIKQGLEQIGGDSVELVFTPHLVPMIRGIHATLYGQLEPHFSDMGVEDLHAVIDRRFAGEPFVDVMPVGSHPDTRSVRGSNTCRLAIHKPGNGNTVVILVVEDNLVKGAAGQAIQNLNLMCGLEETCGLEKIALVP